jgi:hypothetical protein
MATVGQSRLIQFWIADVASVPITTCTLSSFAISFTRDGAACADGLSLVNNGAGSYCLQYTPTAAGRDAVTIDDTVNDLYYCDIEPIVLVGSDGLDLVTVTQDYGGVGALLPSAPQLATFTLYAYFYSDWSVGNNDPSYALASYQLDSSGAWSLTLVPGTYTLVLTNNIGTTIVFQPRLVVA